MDAPAALSEHAASFGAQAGAYARARPSYPAGTLDWLLPPSATRVLDLGAGTGKLTRPLVERGLDVVAVDPSAAMLAELRALLPGVRTHQAGAEAIPLPDASVDAVLVAQAWHWVDPERAVPEVARVLRPGGRLGLVWNLRDERHDWVARLGRLLHSEPVPGPGPDGPRVGPPFGQVEFSGTEWSQTLTPDALLDLVASRSYVITMAEPQRRELLAAVAELLREHPATAGRDTVELPYVTRAFRTSRS